MRKWILAAPVLLSLAFCGAPPAVAPASAAPDPSAATLFRWEMPPRFGAERDARGLLVETQPWQVSRGPWTVLLEVSARACAEGNHYRWTISGQHTPPHRLAACRFSFTVPREGRHAVALEVTTPRANLVEAQRVDVRDWLIVSIGDSVASGEGVPEAKGRWQSARCHRSALSGTALAARQIERDDVHSSVTFVHLACSGAEVPEGLLGPYAGAVPPDEEPPLTPQVEELDRIAQRRKVDAVLLSVGANDVHFSEFLSFCLGHPFGDCFRHTYTKVGGDGKQSAEAVAKGFVADLPRRYADLARAISGPIPANRVHIVEYFDPTRDAQGRPCRRLIGDIFRANVERAQDLLFTPLNRAVAAAAQQHSWDEVTGVADLYRTHGICAGKQAWVSSLPDSLLKLKGLLGRHRGAMHPNEAGHEATSRLIVRSLERDLDTRAFAPEPAGDDKSGEGGQGPEDSSGDSALDDAVEVLLTALAALAIALTVGPLPLALLLLGAGWESGAPILLGVLLAILLLLRPRNIRHLLRPFRALARSGRPLLLPLMVIVAVGTVKWSATAQILVTAALLVLGWRLIVVPEAGRAGVNLAFERVLAKKIAKHAAIAIVAGLLAVIAFRELVLPNTAYFEAIGDAASGLLLLGLLLWLTAIVLRLVSHATSGLRAAIATLIGLCLLIPAMALGLLPWGGDLGDAWPSLLAILAACALLLLFVEGIRYLIANPSEAAEEQQELDSRGALIGRIRGLGFSAAASATVVLAIATGWAMIDAADKGKPLNPPEEDSALVAAAVPAAPAASGLDLAKRYAPVLAFTKGERWTPVRVDPYVARARLTGPAGTPGKLADYGAVSSCPQSRSWCYTLTIDCPSGEEECAHAVHREPTTRDRETLHEEGAVYVRVVDRDALPLAQRKAVFAAGGPFGEKLTKLIQYWYWYEYDVWEAPVFAGLLTQRHEGDWEAVTLGLEDDRHPLFLAYSAHCGGSWRRWREVEASTLPAGPRVHPLVAVAEGSHANYPAADQKRSPNWATCAGLPAGVTDAIGFASNIRDRTEYAWPWYPSPQGWIEVGAKTPPMSFKGSWGADDRMTLRNFRTNQLGDPGHGPLSPPLQALWREPVPLIFCGKYTPRECEAR